MSFRIIDTVIISLFILGCLGANNLRISSSPKHFSCFFPFNLPRLWIRGIFLIKKRSVCTLLILYSVLFSSVSLLDSVSESDFAVSPFNLFRYSSISFFSMVVLLHSTESMLPTGVPLVKSVDSS